MTDMLQELEAQTRIDDLERELREISAAGLVVVPEMRSEVGEKKGRPHAVLPAVLVVALIAAACSGPPARAGESPTVPEVTATEAAAIPGMQDQVRIPAIGSEVTPSPTTEAVPAAPKPLPEVISAETVKFENPPVDQVQTMIDEAKNRGELKIPLPDILLEQGISLVEIQNNRGETAFAITSSREGTFIFPALTKGRVSQVIRGTGVMSGVGFRDHAGDLSYGYIAPPGSQSKIFVNEGEVVGTGQQIIEVIYDPNSESGQRFVKGLLGAQFKNAPPNTVVVIGPRTGASFTKENILTALGGAPVIVGATGKG